MAYDPARTDKLMAYDPVRTGKLMAYDPVRTDKPTNGLWPCEN